ncbi:hypothetical protein K466DRAFT_507611, partial [Polyporus arcularius HHB13444]
RDWLSHKCLRLSQLFFTLPSSVPFGTNHSAFDLDSEDISDLGYSGALNRCFHSVWGYKCDHLKIDQQGPKLDSTLRVIQLATWKADNFAVIESWVDALISAAELVHRGHSDTR